MYLVVLLATYLSAIYGYNLSVRPEFDRDIVRKKASSVIYKFNFHHNAVFNYIKAHSELEDASDWVFPDDMVYATENSRDGIISTAEYKSSISSTTKTIDFGEDDSKYLLTSHTLYGKDMMVSKVMCPALELYKYDERYEGDDKPGSSDKVSCVPPKNGEGAVTGTCCDYRTGRYIISYRKLDARWLSRLTHKLSADMLWAIAERPFNYNIGVIMWDGDNWVFSGRIRFAPVYYIDKQEYMKEHGAYAYYPARYRKRTTWVISEKILPHDYFTDATGTDKDFCKDGCLMRIQSF